ncbi:MAG: prolyl oligopeptidase family serine peptidase [Siphonobacter sp.]
MLFFRISFILIFSLASIHFGQAQNKPSLEEQVQSLQKQLEGMRHSFDQLNKAIDDLEWSERVRDIAFMDKVLITGPAPAVIKNPTGQGAKNPVKFSAYVFIPKDVDLNKKYPLLVLPHDGVHSNFQTAYAHVVRELIAQGYVIVAPEYRGSSGYGQGFYQLIDYGGLEVEDVDYSRDYVLKNYDIIDKDRVGILGWSHGGMITLLDIFAHPDHYKVAYSGVPVSDLIARMGYKNQGYRDIYSVDYHLGKSADENVEEYRKRSPAWNTHKLQTPLLIHTNTNDEDVNVLEVEHLIKSLKADGKKFEYEIYKDMPGGHVFDRLDSFAAREIRMKIYKFLGGYLHPAKPFKSLQNLVQASYMPVK